MKKVFRATRKDQYVQPGEFDPGRYTFHAVVKGEVYSFALKTESGSWLNFDLSWQLEEGEWSRITHTFDLMEKCVEFSIFASDTASEVLIGDPMLEEGNNRSTPSVSPLDLDEVSENISERVTVNFDVLDDRIKSRVSQEDFDALGNRVSTAESTITQQADEIDLKVSKDGVVSSINQTPESVKIDAEKIEFTGSVSFSNATKDVMEDDISGLQSDVQDALAKANTSKAITDKFATTIDGGLISTVITEYRELNSEQVTGLVSGIQGANKNLPFLVAGGTYAEGIAGSAKAIIRHDGTSKFTDTEITGTVNATSGAIGDLSLYSGVLSSYDPSLPVIPFGDQIQLSKNEISIRSTSSGQPQIVTEASIKNSLITVRSGPLGGPYNSTEIRPDGIYKNGVKVL